MSVYINLHGLHSHSPLNLLVIYYSVSHALDMGKPTKAILSVINIQTTQRKVMTCTNYRKITCSPHVCRKSAKGVIRILSALEGTMVLCATQVPLQTLDFLKLPENKWTKFWCILSIFLLPSHVQRWSAHFMTKDDTLYQDTLLVMWLKNRFLGFTVLLRQSVLALKYKWFLVLKERVK